MSTYFRHNKKLSTFFRTIHGVRVTHEYQLYLALEDIGHSRTKARHHQTNGICEGSHKTIQDDFYAITLRGNIYSTLKELRTVIDKWLDYYNQIRNNYGKCCFGKTPVQTFIDSIHLAKEKQLTDLYRPICLVNHSSCVMTYDNTFNAIARPEISVGLREKAFVHFSLENAEKIYSLLEP